MSDAPKPEVKEPESLPDDAPKAKAPADSKDAVIAVAQRVEDAEDRLDKLEKRKAAEAPPPAPPAPPVVGEPPPEKPSIFARALRFVASAMDDDVMP